MGLWPDYGQQPPFPLQPQPPQQPQTPQAQVPMVYVYEHPRWEYMVLVESTADEAAVSEHRLNEVGSKGWELAGAVALPDAVRLYLKRARS